MIGILNGMLPHRQSQKMVLSQKCRELQSEFAPHHLERDLGGTRPTLQTFFPFPLQAGPFDAGCQVKCQRQRLLPLLPASARIPYLDKGGAKLSLTTGLMTRTRTLATHRL